VLVSEQIEFTRTKINCTSCDYATEKTLAPSALSKLEEQLVTQQCPKCQNQSLQITETEDLIEELEELVKETSAEIEVISPETEEGKQLLTAFRGIGAILRWSEHS